MSRISSLRSTTFRSSAFSRFLTCAGDRSSSKITSSALRRSTSSFSSSTLPLPRTSRDGSCRAAEQHVRDLGAGGVGEQRQLLERALEVPALGLGVPHQDGALVARRAGHVERRGFHTGSGISSS
jgi:hypothetical protein